MRFRDQGRLWERWKNAQVQEILSPGDTTCLKRLEGGFGAEGEKVQPMRERRRVSYFWSWKKKEVWSWKKKEAMVVKGLTSLLAYHQKRVNSTKNPNSCLLLKGYWTVIVNIVIHGQILPLNFNIGTKVNMKEVIIILGRIKCLLHMYAIHMCIHIYTHIYSLLS